MRPADLAGRPILVLGVGIDVAAALDVVVAAGPSEVTVVDHEPGRAEAALAAAGHGDLPVVGSVEEAPDAEVAVRSPGFSPYQPAVAARVAAGLRTVTPLGLWLSERGERPSVAVTGTKGKSSTSVLVAMALEHLGHPAVVLGNFGTPPWGEEPGSARTPVLEVSSYQALDLPVTAPVAALTAVGEDHVSWHGTVEQYLRDKARVFTAPLPGGGAASRWCGVPSTVTVPPAFAGVDFTVVPVPADDLRAGNATLAAAAALAVAGSPDADPAELAAELVARYPDLPGRFSTVGVVDGTEFVDDALASAPLGAAAGLRSLAGRRVALIAGGSDRGASLDPVLAAIRGRPARTTTVLAVDDAAGHLAAFEGAGAEVLVVDDLEVAVAVAAERLRASGGVVLFAPAMPTPSAQGSWVDRSQRFRAAAEAQRGVGGTP